MSKEITVELVKLRDGDPDAPGRLLGLVYDDLRRMARGYMRHERPDHTLQATALVHEAYMRVSRLPNQAFADRDEFFRIMGSFMRRELVDHARRKRANVRGGHFHRVDMESIVPPAAPARDTDDTEVFLRGLDAALAVLAQEHPRVARVVELRFFAQLTIEDVASRLGTSPGTVKRDVVFAKAWLRARLEEPAEASDDGAHH